MNSPAQTPRTGVSVEARSWLAANPPVPRVEPTLQNAAALRAATAAAYAPAIAAVRSEFDVIERDVLVDEVPCLELTGGERTDVVVLYCFGGGYVQGSPEEDLVVAAPIAAALGGRVVVPRYPLSPEHPYPAASDMMLRAYRSLLEEYPADHIVVTGESAGGNLALVTLLRAREEGLSLPAGIALLSPWSDLGFGGDSHLTDRDPTLPMSDGALRRSADAFRGAMPADHPYISPIHAGFAGFPPTFISTGTRDLLLSDCVRLSTGMRLDGVDVTLRVWEGMWHVFEFYRELPEARASTSEVSTWIIDQLP